MIQVLALRPETPSKVLPFINPDLVEFFLNEVKVIKHTKQNKENGISDKNYGYKAFLNARKQSINSDLKEKNQDQNIFMQMASLVRLAEQSPERLIALEAQAQKLYFDNPDVPGLKILMKRLTKKTKWELISNLNSSGAGIRYIPLLNSWSPESPKLRVRKALLSPVKPDEYIVYGQGQVVIYMENHDTAYMEINLELADLFLLMPTSLIACVQLDNNPEKNYTLTPDMPVKKIKLIVPQGRHRIVARIKDTYANQFLKIKIKEGQRGNKRKKLANTLWYVTDERSYNVATEQEPIEFIVHGPAWLRIDELKNDYIDSKYRFVNKGWQKRILTPEPGQTEGLFRIHIRKAISGNIEPVRIRNIKVSYTKVPEPIVNITPWKSTQNLSKKTPIQTIQNLEFKKDLSGSSTQNLEFKKDLSGSSTQNLEFKKDLSGSSTHTQNIELVDKYPLGTQEDGTWDLRLSHVRRNNIEEDISLNDMEKFYEISTTHRFFEESMPGYFKTGFLTRVRDFGGPILSVSHDLDTSG